MLIGMVFEGASHLLYVWPKLGLKDLAVSHPSVLSRCHLFCHQALLVSCRGFKSQFHSRSCFAFVALQESGGS